MVVVDCLDLCTAVRRVAQRIWCFSFVCLAGVYAALIRSEVPCAFCILGYCNSSPRVLIGALFSHNCVHHQQGVDDGRCMNDKKNRRQKVTRDICRLCYG